MSVTAGPFCQLGYPKGQIQLIFGPMFSGKTTELIRRMKRYQLANHCCLMVKYARDLRYESGSSVATHDRQTLSAVPATCLGDVKSVAQNCSVIGIDEGQFFPDVVEFSEAMANAGKTVIVAALDGTYKRHGFGDILNLVPLAEQVVKLTAVCMLCYGEAAYTQRLGSETEVEVIGGTEKYMAVCRECYFRCNGSTPNERGHGNCVSSPFKDMQQHRSPLKQVQSAVPPNGTNHFKHLHF